MKIADRIKKFMNRNNPELIAGNVADAYLERKENKEKRHKRECSSWMDYNIKNNE